MVTPTFPCILYEMQARVPQVFNVHRRKKSRTPTGELDQGARHREIIQSPATIPQEVPAGHSRLWPS